MEQSDIIVCSFLTNSGSNAHLHVSQSNVSQIQFEISECFELFVIKLLRFSCSIFVNSLLELIPNAPVITFKVMSRRFFWVELTLVCEELAWSLRHVTVSLPILVPNTGVA